MLCQQFRLPQQGLTPSHLWQFRLPQQGLTPSHLWQRCHGNVLDDVHEDLKLPAVQPCSNDRYVQPQLLGRWAGGLATAAGLPLRGRLLLTFGGSNLGCIEACC